MKDWQYVANGRLIGKDEMASAAAALLAASGSNKVWKLDGDLGAGKTTLLKHVAAQLGVQQDVFSPTFSLMNVYDLPNRKKIYHFDFYRVLSEDEIWDLDVSDYFSSGEFCWVEWGERFPQFFPLPHFQLFIEQHTDQRKIKYRTYDGKEINRI